MDAPSTQYAHNALGQRVFKTEPLFASGSGSGSTTSSKNLNNLLADPEDQEEAEKEQDKGFIQTAYEFFTRLWSPGSSDAQKLGFAYVYGQDGTLLGEYGMGGSNSSGTTQYIYLPTANGPMPIAAIINGVAYAVHSDHLNTPRKLTQPDGQVAWQWAYSAFGDEQPTLGSKRFTNETTTPTTGTTTIPEVTFNLRYPGQYYDKESNLHYNYFRSYSAERGRYTQADPIGLDGGFNRFGYVEGNALSQVDPTGLQPIPKPRPPVGGLWGGAAANDPTFGGGGGGGCNCENFKKILDQYYYTYIRMLSRPDFPAVAKAQAWAGYQLMRRAYIADCGPYVEPSAPSEPSRDIIDDYYSK
ncbi:RHS repeat-associated core domain protein containing protein [Acidovorax sp. CF316]|uniref:RHS repeat domain-containing protein n=1 Tax=Acidovorax sp. CF316 TaxID=1144317 RepID=UPI00026BC77C|nr:RHS repeat-associated core domain-containing protein [Acidovorax sp. CF316]EJE51323.1 RHS repeat-associated core domain protein containing protein [Acidovorax sp. CF316]